MLCLSLQLSPMIPIYSFTKKCIEAKFCLWYWKNGNNQHIKHHLSGSLYSMGRLGEVWIEKNKNIKNQIYEMSDYKNIKNKIYEMSDYDNLQR